MPALDRDGEAFRAAARGTPTVVSIGAITQGRPTKRQRAQNDTRAPNSMTRV